MHRNHLAEKVVLLWAKSIQYWKSYQVQVGKAKNRDIHDFWAIYRYTQYCTRKKASWPFLWWARAWSYPLLGQSFQVQGTRYTSLCSVYSSWVLRVFDPTHFKGSSCTYKKRGSFSSKKAHSPMIAISPAYCWVLCYCCDCCAPLCIHDDVTIHIPSA